MSHSRLKLPLASGAFSVLLGPDASQTCYTDASGTSRTAFVAPEALLAFAHAVIEQLTTASRRGADAS